MVSRDAKIDLLRAIGLLLIIVAHTSTSGVILQLRNFDVALMVFVMGASYALSMSDRKKQTYAIYISKRFKRLILPAWIFLLVYFCVCAISGHIHYDCIDYFDSFTLRSGIPGYAGIGYVWIFRVYFLMAIISPIMLKSSMKCGSKAYWAIFLGTVVLFNLFAWIDRTLLPLPDSCLLTIMYCIGYGLILELGMIINRLSKKQGYLIGTICLFIFLTIFFVCSKRPTQSEKYPPTIYYSSYAVFMIIVCYYVANSSFGQIISGWTCIPWLSRNSMRIYLWHIVVLNLVSIVQEKHSISSLENGIVRFWIVLILSCSFTSFHNRLCIEVKRIYKEVSLRKRNIT